MKNSLLLTCLIFLATVPSFVVRAGQSVMWTSNDDPLYPTSGPWVNTEVILPSQANQTAEYETVSLGTRSNDGGNVYVTYTLSDGIVQTNDDGWGTQSELGTFSFSSSCIGKVNTITISVSHEDASGLSFCSNNTTTTYTICIPAVAVSVNGPTPAGPAIVNSFNGFAFMVKYTVSGIDDVHQLGMTQYIDAFTTYESSATGFWLLSGVGVPSNTYGAYEVDTDWPDPPSTALSDNSNFDEQVWTIVPSPGSVTASDGKSYNWDYYGQLQRLYQTYMVRMADNAKVSEFDWGYQWVSTGDTWPSPPGAPSGYGDCSFGGLVGAANPPIGHFQNITGITGLHD